MPKAPREVTLASRESISPHIVRMTLTGETLTDFPTGFEGGYIKLILPRGESRPVARSYTVRRFDPSSRELSIDMVAHGDTGPAASWANRAQPGDRVLINGPGACRRVDPGADWFLLAGDMSALPAIAVNLSLLPNTATGYVVIEIVASDDRQRLDVPPGMEVQWLVNPEPESKSSKLTDTVTALPWPDGRPSIWVAGEFSTSRALRNYFRHDRQVAAEDMYVSCYWKIGDTDEGMKQAKRADPEPW